MMKYFGSSFTGPTAAAFLRQHKEEFNPELLVLAAQTSDGKFHGKTSLRKGKHGLASEQKKYTVKEVLDNCCDCVVSAVAVVKGKITWLRLNELANVLSDCLTLETLDFTAMTFSEVVKNREALVNWQKDRSHFVTYSRPSFFSRYREFTHLVTKRQKECVNVMETSEFRSNLIRKVMGLKPPDFATGDVSFPSSMKEKRQEASVDAFVMLSAPYKPFDFGPYRNWNYSALGHQRFNAINLRFDITLILDSYFVGKSAALLPRIAARELVAGWLNDRAISLNVPFPTGGDWLPDVDVFPTDSQFEIMKSLFDPTGTGLYSSLAEVYKTAVSV